MTTVLKAAPVAIRSFQPAYASWHTSTSAGLSGEEKQPHTRFAVCAPDISATSLLKHLHKMTGHNEPVDGEIRALDHDSVVKVLGWRAVEKNGSHFLVYTILAASRQETSSHSEARLVQRRFRDFAKLHAALVPRARSAGLLLPALPSKMTFGRSLDAIGAQRKETLHVWLSSVVAQPALMCTELRCFLGLSPREETLTRAASSESERSADTTVVGMDVDEPERPSSTASVQASAGRDQEDGVRLIAPSAPYTENGRSQGMGEQPPYAVHLKELEARAVECMLDDDLWGRR